MSLFTWAHLRTFLFIVLNSTRNRSIATTTCWMKNFMMGAIAGVAGMELARVVLLQILGGDGVLWSTHRWNQNDLTSPGFFRIKERNPPFLWVSRALILRHSVGEIFLRVLIHLDTDFFSSVMFEKCRISFGIDRESLRNLLMHLFLKLWATWWSLCSFVFRNRWPWGRPCFMRTFWIERRPNVHWRIPRLESLLSRDGRKCNNDALIPVKQAFFELQLKNCLTQLKELYIAHVLNHLLGHVHWMGCRHYFVVDRLEDVVDEGGSRSSWRAHEHENFQLFFTTECCNPSNLSEVDVHLVERYGRTDWLSNHNGSHRSISTSNLSFLQSREKRVPISWALERNVFSPTMGLVVFGWFGWLTSAGRATSEPKSFIQSCSNEIFGGCRSDANTFSYMIPPVSIMIAFGLQWAGSVM